MNNIKSVFFALLAVFSVIFFLSCTREDIDDFLNPSSNSNGDGEPAYCAGKEYDPGIFRCVSGELIGRCMGTDYYFDYEICENGEIKPRNSSSSGNYSSSNIYSSSSSLNTISQCNGVDYNPELYRCVSGELVGKCRGEDYYPPYQTCDNGVIVEVSSSSSFYSSGSIQTCGGQSYDPTVLRCESGELIGRCMGVDYYYDYQVCENGVVKPKGTSSSSLSSSSIASSSSVLSSSSNANYRMCGGISYNPDIFRCEDGEVIGRCMGVDYYYAYQVCNNGVIETKNDCKGVSFVPSLEFCSVQDSLVYNRCNGATYNTALQDCCGSTVFTLGTNRCREGVLLHKCGNDFYDPATEFCSGNVIYAKCNDSTYNVNVYGCRDNTITPKCSNEFYNSSTQFCSAQDSLVYDKCNGAAYNTITHGCKGNTVMPKCADELYNSAIQFCSTQETKVYDKCGGATFNTITQSCCNNVIYTLAAQSCSNGSTISKITTGNFTDSRDGRVYKWAEIGAQVWMAENLNYEFDGSKCYDNALDNCERYGRLYNWSAANGVCPTGWHLPSNAEWTTLIDYVGGSATAGKELRANSGDEYKFSALMGGGHNGNSFLHVNSIGYWWTSSSDQNIGYTQIISHNQNNITSNVNLNYRLFSVRCIKN